MTASLDMLRDALSGPVLENIARCGPSRLLHGQPVRSRLSRRRRFPKVDFYGQERMSGGLPGHRHRHHELATVLDGRLNMILDPVVYQCRRGDWIVLGPGVLHGECCLTTHEPYRLMWFVLTPTHLGVHLTRYTRSGGYEVLAAERLGDVPAEVRSVLRQLGQGVRQGGVQTRCRLVELVGWCLRGLPSRAAAKQRVHPMIAEVQEILLRRIVDPPPVVELAAAVGLSPNYLSNLFHRESGVTIRRFVEDRRMREARRLLSDPERSVKQVAYELGFADPYHFSHAFRRVTGRSPSAYRREHIEDTRT